jgi:hypothetical protein
MLRFVAVSLSLLALLPIETACAEDRVLNALVEPMAISLTDASGAPVTRLDAGSYTVNVEDRSASANFHLHGRGVDVDSGLAFVGRTTWTLTLVDSHFTYVSDPLAGSMQGRFVVGSPPAATLTASVGPGRAISLAGADGLAPGLYSIAVRDQSEFDNFRLEGPGVSEHTQGHVRFETVWTVELAAGVYHWFSERNAETLKGSFRVGGAEPATPDRVLRGTTGRDFSIALVRSDASPVTALDAGAYTVRVNDTSPDHNFRLKGPGVERATQLDAVGEQAWDVVLRAGSYRFVCDPHELTMATVFTVRGGAAAVRTVTATVSPAGRASLTSTRLRPGPHVFVVRDRSVRAGFVLRGPGVSRSTGKAFRGTARWRVTLRRGTYRYGVPGALRTFRVS